MNRLPLLGAFGIILLLILCVLRLVVSSLNVIAVVFALSVYGKFLVDPQSLSVCRTASETGRLSFGTYILKEY
jgi:hypothetical protein